MKISLLDVSQGVPKDEPLIKYFVNFLYSDADGDANEDEISYDFMATSPEDALRQFFSDARFDSNIEFEVDEDGDVTFDGDCDLEDKDCFGLYTAMRVVSVSGQIQELEEKKANLERQIKQINDDIKNLQ